MKKIMLIHSVTMGLLLAGMFGLSMAAMELSKETKVGAEGSLVTPSGAVVLVGSSEMQVVSGELRSRASSDDESASALVTVSTPDAVVLDLGVDGESGGRRLGDAHAIYDLTYCKVKTLLDRMPKREATFTPKLDAAGDALIEVGEIVGEIVGGQDISALRKRWQKKRTMRMRLHSRKTNEQVQVDVACDSDSCDESCNVAWTSNKNKGDFDLATFLTGTDLNSDDEVLCVKLADSAACQNLDKSKGTSFSWLESYRAVEDVDYALNFEGDLEGPGCKVTFIRHYRDGKRQEIGLPGILSVKKDDKVLLRAECANAIMYAAEYNLDKLTSAR